MGGDLLNSVPSSKAWNVGILSSLNTAHVAELTEHKS